MRIISMLLFSILVAGLTVSVAAIEITSDEPLYMGWPVSITGTHPYGEAGADIFIAVYPGYSGAADIPGPERSGAEIETFVTTGDEGVWNYQFVPNYVPGEYLIYADVIGTIYHESIIVPILYCSTAPLDSIATSQPDPVIPQPEPTAVPTISDIETTTPLSLFPIIVGVLGGLAVFAKQRRNNQKP